MRTLQFKEVRWLFPSSAASMVPGMTGETWLMREGVLLTSGWVMEARLEGPPAQVRP